MMVGVKFLNEVGLFTAEPFCLCGKLLCSAKCHLTLRKEDMAAALLQSSLEQIVLDLPWSNFIWIKQGNSILSYFTCPLSPVQIRSSLSFLGDNYHHSLSPSPAWPEELF